MAPVFDKRSQSHSKDHTKENVTKYISTNKGPEILDFRDSWLQEIEVYKGQARAQQLLTTQNNMHSTEGNSLTFKRRTRLKSDDHHDEKLRAHKDHADDEFVLKRPRDEYSVYARVGNTINNSGGLLNKTVHFKNQSVYNQTTTSSTGGPKIIVNNYHANSLLNSYGIDKKTTTVTDFASTKSHKITTNSSPDKQKNDSFKLTKNTKKNQEENLVTPTVEVVTIEKALNKAEEMSKLSCVDDLVKTPEAVKEEKSFDGSSNADDNDDDDNDNNDNIDTFGDIDNVKLFDDSSDEDEEYIGTPYHLTSDKLEENCNNCIEQQDIDNTRYFTPESILTASLFPNVPPYLTFSSHAEKGPPLPPELQKILKWKLSPVMPKIVRRVVINSGFRLIKKTTDWMAVWEKHMKSPSFKTIRSHQKFNHIPGSFKIGRKDSVWRNLRCFMLKYGKKEFGFMQKTFILPQELDLLKKAWPKYAKRSTKWIVKPPASARGTGISVVNKWSDFPKQKPLIVQKYIERPLLINGSKFDLRLYIIVTSINPLRIFMHKDGLARFASVQYSSKLDTLNDRCMHLTNYSVNKYSSNYAKNEDVNACQGHKWTLKSLWSYFRTRKVDTNRLWGTIRNLVIKTVIGGESCLNRMFRQNVNSRYNCYELFGFDVLLDENLIPWLLEVNISPSLHSDLPLDLHIKGPLMQAVLNTALYQVPPKLNERQQINILKQLKLKGPLCYDRRLYTTCLSQEEIKKHNNFTNKSMEFREEYLDSILENLTPDDIRCLIIAEDEFARCLPLERIFPSAESHIFLKFIDSPRYYNRLLDAWESKFSEQREKGIKILQDFCQTGVHLQVPPAALEQEPTLDLTDIDLLHFNSYRKTDASNNTSGDKAEPVARVIGLQEIDMLVKKAAETTVKSTDVAVDNSSNKAAPCIV